MYWIIGFLVILIIALVGVAIVIAFMKTTKSVIQDVEGTDFSDLTVLAIKDSDLKE